MRKLKTLKYDLVVGSLYQLLPSNAGFLFVFMKLSSVSAVYTSERLKIAEMSGLVSPLCLALV